MVPYLRAANVKDGYLDLRDVKSMDFSPAEQVSFSVRPGDVLVTEGAGSLAAVGASAVWGGEIEETVCFQNTLVRLRPAPETYPRYLLWWARHAYGSGLFAAAANGANIYHLGVENVRQLPAHIPTRRSQQAIADYLDAETARIDEIVTSLRRANQLLDQWLASVIDDVVWARSDRTVPLLRLTPDDRPIQYGIVLPGPNVPEGVPIVKGGDIVTGRLSASRLNRTTAEIELRYARSRLRAGDLVFAIRGAVGACAIVPSEVEGANITQDVARISPIAGVDPNWLLFVMRSTSAQAQVESRMVGATIQGINIRDLKRVRIPWLTLPEQRKRAATLVDAQRYKDQVTSAREHQLTLLAERRRALITSAVTGALEIPGGSA